MAAQILRASGVTVFVDLYDLEYGMDWRNQVEKAIGQAERVLLFWSEQAARSRWVLMEVQLARRMERIIVPVILDATPMPAKLRHIHAITDLGTIILRYCPAPAPLPSSSPSKGDTSRRSTLKERLERVGKPRVHVAYDVEPFSTPQFAAQDVEAFVKAVLGDTSSAP